MGIKMKAGEGEKAPKRGDVYSLIPSMIVANWEDNHSRQGEVITEESVADLVADFLNPEMGQVQAAIGFRRPHDQQVEMVAGFRRLMAGLVVERIKPEFRLRVEVRTDINENDRYLINLKENVGRKATNAIQNAKSARHLKTVFKWKLEPIAKLFGVSVSQVSNLLQLLTLPEAVQARVISGKLTPSAALKFVKMAPEQIEAALDEATDEEGNVDGGVAAKAARSRGVKVGRSVSELRKVLSGRVDAISEALIGFLAGTVTEEALTDALDEAEAPIFTEVLASAS